MTSLLLCILFVGLVLIALADLVVLLFASVRIERKLDIIIERDELGEPTGACNLAPIQEVKPPKKNLQPLAKKIYLFFRGNGFDDNCFSQYVADNLGELVQDCRQAAKESPGLVYHSATDEISLYRDQSTTH